MPPASWAFSSTGLAGPVAFGAGLLLLAFAPIIRGGNRHVAMVLLEWLGLLVLLLLAVQWAGATRAPGRGTAPLPVTNPSASAAVLLLGLAPLWTGLVQLTPLPASLWAALPGRELYVQALGVAQAPAAAFRPLSLMPDTTWVSVLAGIPLTAAFLLAHTCTPRQLTVLTRALVIFALAQAVLGLLQMGAFAGLYFDAAAADRAIGSFANRNHFASYIAMTVPLAILALRQGHAPAPARGGTHGGRWSGGALWGVVLFILLAAVAGIQLPGGRRHLPGGHPARGAAAAAPKARAGAALAPGGLCGPAPAGDGGRRPGCVDVPLRERPDPLPGRRPLDDGHQHLARRPGVLACGFLGPSFFAAAFPGFQPAGLRGFVNHAHNDYIQLLMECGLLAERLPAPLQNPQARAGRPAAPSAARCSRAIVFFLRRPGRAVDRPGALHRRRQPYRALWRHPGHRRRSAS